jgi:septum site-determining protein MinC
MPVNLSKEKVQPATFELKADTFTLPLLRLLSTDMDTVAKQLAEKLNQAPDFFRNTPIVIDLKEVADQESGVDFALLVGLLRGHGMVPIGVRGGNEVHNDAANTLELAILSEGQARKTASAKPSTQPAAPKKNQVKSESPGGSLLITRPVRSGQRIYASGGDLVIMAPVSSGAEVMADGHIHVYGVLRGRALAGVRGNRECRIFCKNLQAELVSVAGHYRISENLDAAIRGKPVHIYLKDQSLKIDEI